MIRALILPGAAALLVVSGATSRAATQTPAIVFSADRSPTVTGEIYRLDPNGHRVDLSRSPYQDTDPVVSPDGRHVAFFSDRGNGWAVYEVGSNGKGLRRLGPAADVQASGGQLMWQPHGRLLAVSTDGRIWIDAGHKPIPVKRKGFYTGRWSQDGHVLLLTTRSEVDAVTPSGHELWHAHGWGGGGASAWSPQGLLAISAGHGAAVYDESGHLRLRFGLPTTSPSFSWSPDGRYLAVSWSGATHQRLEVRTSGGSLVLQARIPGGDLGWADDFRVVGGDAPCSTCRSVGADVRTGKLSPASSRWLDPLSSNRRLAIVTPPSKPAFTLGVAPPAGGHGRTYARVGGCFGDGVWMPAVSSLQFVGGGSSLVYQSWNYCDEPFSNLYSVTPGGGVQRLTDVQAQETQPALSPDGSEIAYVWAEATGLSCKGCPDGIRLAGADGTAIRTLTDPADCTFDESPTWSPDGTTILYSEDTCDSGGELYTVPAAGGTPHDLGIAGAVPTWGPSKIAYVGSDQSDAGLWTANPDGTDRVLVDRQGGMPAWSPDGRLAYLVGDLYHRTLVVGASRVSLPFGRVTSLAWSPDGTRLVVTASKTRLGPSDVYTIDPDGTDLVRLTANYGATGASWR